MFSLLYILQFSKEIRHYSGLDKPDNVESQNIKLSLIVVGPLDNDHKKNTGKLSCITVYASCYWQCLTLNLVNQIIEMLSRSGKFFVEGSIMLIFRPLEVEGRKVNDFVDWEPESTE